ncbi:hypothetical protein [Brevundimonas sp.]|uniref:hypothetical protein n=1 Tax=Brevundimonas sp. TaxID=1871086 RepID=UPI003D0D0500
MGGKKSGSRQLWLVLLMAASFAVVFLFPAPRQRVGTVAFAAATAHDAQVAVVGNSVVTHVSKCDADRRAIPAMLQDALASEVVDLSYGGEPLAESINYAAIALQQPRIRTVVLYLGQGSLANPDPNDWQTTAFFGLVAGPLRVNDLSARLSRGTGITPGAATARLPFRYEGVDYPGYDQIQMTWFADEKARQGCPETLGHDRRFIEANFWTNLVRPQPYWPLLEDIGDLQRQADARGKRLVVLFLPNDMAGLRTLDAGLAAQVDARRAEIVRRAAAFGVAVTEIAPFSPDQFADRWCACGHLSQSGRLAVAAATKDVLVN